MTSPRLRTLRLTLRLALAALYVGFGALHLAAPDGFTAIVPPFIAFPREVVLATGACEIAGGLGLLAPATLPWPVRLWAARMLALYALCVWPANLYHAFWRIHLPPLPDSWWYHAPRLALQPLLIWWPLFAGGVTDWPFGRGGAGAATPEQG